MTFSGTIGAFTTAYEARGVTWNEALSLAEGAYVHAGSVVAAATDAFSQAFITAAEVAPLDTRTNIMDMDFTVLDPEPAPFFTPEVVLGSAAALTALATVRFAQRGYFSQGDTRVLLSPTSTVLQTPPATVPQTPPATVPQTPLATVLQTPLASAHSPGTAQAYTASTAKKTTVAGKGFTATTSKRISSRGSQNLTPRVTRRSKVLTRSAVSKLATDKSTASYLNQHIYINR